MNTDKDSSCLYPTGWYNEIDVCGKEEKDDLTANEKRLLADLAKTARQEAIDAFHRSEGVR